MTIKKKKRKKDREYYKKLTLMMLCSIPKITVWLIMGLLGLLALVSLILIIIDSKGMALVMLAVACAVVMGFILAYIKECKLREELQKKYGYKNIVTRIKERKNDDKKRK